MLPFAVRKYEVEETPLFACRLLHKEPMRVLSEFEKADALLEVAFIGGLVILDPAQASILLSSPLSCLSVEEGSVDAPIELVDVHRVNSVLQTAILGLQAADGSIMMTLLVLVTGAKCIPHPRQGFIVEVEL